MTPFVAEQPKCCSYNNYENGYNVVQRASLMAAASLLLAKVNYLRIFNSFSLLWYIYRNLAETEHLGYNGFNGYK